MAKLYPFSSRMADILTQMPGAGGTHHWLAQVAGGLKHILSAEECFSFLGRCCEMHVTHRAIPEKEIASAIRMAYSDKMHMTNFRSGVNFGQRAMRWPKANPAAIEKVIAKAVPLFDAEPAKEMRSVDVLPYLFLPNDLLCVGSDIRHSIIRLLKETIYDADIMQFICPNPMKGLWALNKEGDQSRKCQNNVRVRRFLIAESDSPTLNKLQQAKLITALAAAAPLALVVDSGSKSLHGWFFVEKMCLQDQARFFSAACALGADPSLWNIASWVRMPGGLRVKDGIPSLRQRILFFNSAVVTSTISTSEI